MSENQEIEDRLESLILRVGEKVCYHWFAILYSHLLNFGLFLQYQKQFLEYFFIRKQSRRTG